jgi:hypothetical protein
MTKCHATDLRSADEKMAADAMKVEQAIRMPAAQLFDDEAVLWGVVVLEGAGQDVFTG